MTYIYIYAFSTRFYPQQLTTEGLTIKLHKGTLERRAGSRVKRRRRRGVQESARTGGVL